MIDVLAEYSNYCKALNIPFAEYRSIKAYDESTLFCSAGMQQYKKEFVNQAITGLTIANCQKILRVNDLNNLDDGFHLAYFSMLGLFSFRDWSVKQTIQFWLEFVQDWLGLEITKITIHPDKYYEWRNFYPYFFDIVEDIDCIWSDGNISGYSTEFYCNGIEIGNIVNPLGNCIDVGFGLERIEQLINHTKPKTKIENLVDAANAIIAEGFLPSNLKQGYILRKILRTLYKENAQIDLPFYTEEIERQQKIQKKYLKLKDKNPNQSPAWWFDTHGIDIDFLEHNS